MNDNSSFNQNRKLLRSRDNGPNLQRRECHEVRPFSVTNGVMQQAAGNILGTDCASNIEDDGNDDP
jgi:hypothetical protein